MSASQESTPRVTQPQPKSGFRAALHGWVGFAAVFLALAGAMNLIWGIVALANKEYFRPGGPAWSSVTTWGWILLVAGVFQLIAAVLVVAREESGQVLTVMLCCVAILVHFLTLGANSAWSIVAIAANGLVLWAVTAHEDEFY